MVFIYTTCKDLEEAKKISKLIIENRLGACVNIWPIGSYFREDGDIKGTNEVALFIKTMETKMSKIEELISSNHSYSVPCIAALDVCKMNAPYREWVMKNI